MPAPATVRMATAADEPQLIDLLHLMHAEGGLFDLDVDCLRGMLAHAFNRKGGIVGVIGAPGEKIEGAIGLLITRFWYTRKNHLEDYFNFVHPDCRRSNHAATLIEFSKRCATEIGIPLVIGVLTNKRVMSKVRFYRRSLGMPAGAVWVFNGHWVNEAADSEAFWRDVEFPGRHPMNPRVLKEAS